MTADAEDQIVAQPEAETTAPAAVQPEAAPAVEPVALAAAKPARKPRAKAAEKKPAAKKAAEKTTAVEPAPAAPVRGRPRKAKRLVAVKAPKAAKSVKAPRIPVPAATPAPQAAAAPLAARRVAKRQTTKTRLSPQIGQGKPKFASLKETFMATPFDLTQIQTAFADIQGKAKEALEKSTAVLGEANDFAKGNVEAVVESGKTLSAGLQDFGATFVAEARTAFEGLTADAKELAAAKSPTEFFQLQSALVRKQFDGAVAQASKSTEAWLKLANEAFAPISGRVTLAVEKVSKAA